MRFTVVIQLWPQTNAIRFECKYVFAHCRRISNQPQTSFFVFDLCDHWPTHTGSQKKMQRIQICMIYISQNGILLAFRFFNSFVLAAVLDQAFKVFAVRNAHCKLPKFQPQWANIFQIQRGALDPQLLQMTAALAFVLHS